MIQFRITYELAGSGTSLCSSLAGVTLASRESLSLARPRESSHLSHTSQRKERDTGLGLYVQVAKSKMKGTATNPHRGPALVGSQYFDLRHLKNLKTKFRKKI